MARWSLPGGAIACVMIASACASIAGLDDPSDAPVVSDAGIDVITTGVDAANIEPDGGGPPADSSAVDAGPCDEPGLVARWRLQEGTGTRVFDCTSGNHAGDMLGGVAWANGRTGRKAIELDGSDGMKVDFGNDPAFHLTGPITLAAWVRGRTSTSEGRILSKSQYLDRGWELMFQSGASVELRIATDAEAYVSTLATGIAVDQWKHVAAVYVPAVALRIYVDGQQVAQSTTSIPDAQRNSGVNVTIGARPDNCCPFDGFIDDARLYSRALSASEIAALFAAK